MDINNICIVDINEICIFVQWIEPLSFPVDISISNNEKRGIGMTIENIFCDIRDVIWIIVTQIFL